MLSSRAFRLGIWSFASLGASLLATPARADSPSAKCENTLQCSSGVAALQTSSRTRLTTPVDTGWLPSCGNPNPALDHCTDNPLQFRANIAFDAPTQSSQSLPLYEVDMLKSLLDVTWPDQDALTLQLAAGAVNDGKFSVNYTLVPDVSLYLDVDLGILKLNQQFDYNATSLVNQIPGAKFNYLATGSTPFAPWGLEGIQLLVKGPDLSTSRLFSVSLDGLPGLSQYATSSLSVAATTSPTFTYKTTKVTLTGLSEPLAAIETPAKVRYQNADYVDLGADVEGEIVYQGSLEVLPVVDVTFTKFGGFHLSLPISVGVKTQYLSAPTVVTFPRQNIHIPLPNLAVPPADVDFGAIQTGSQADKPVSLNNTGELGVLYTVESSDPQFTVDAGQTRMDPKSKRDLVVRFQPSKNGASSATITVKSNDPDAPVQTFKVSGTANPASLPGTTTEPPAQKSGENSGCGCRMTSLDPANTAGTGLLVLGALAFVRRRRARA